jgi:aryl-alcohol dehydrogenase-like predicted oxidoreductase
MNLVLGGHTFIQQLGIDARPDPDEAAEIVAACLDAGITRFDTTYAPERVALGRALAALGRRDEATVLAWNFFEHFGPDGDLSGPTPYRPDHLERMLDELQTDRIDLLVVHPVEDAAEHARQEQVAAQWLADGRVGGLGTFMPEHATTSVEYTAALAPYNVTTPDAPEAFAGYRRRGWGTYALSPFVRGWELERLVAESGRSTAELADLLLRHSAFAPGVDFVVVAMRKPEWVAANAESWRRGPLVEAERALIGGLSS